jgi:TIR domain
VRIGDPHDASDGVPTDEQARPSLRVFLNYRQQDTQGTAWALYMKLEERFGAGNVFFDRGSLQPGMRWADEITSHMGHSAVVIALIGPQWMATLIAHLQHGGDDYVVKEIDLALRSPRVTVIPALVDNTEIPNPADLPPAIRALASRQAERLRHTNLDSDIDHLIERLGEIGSEPSPQEAGPDVPQPRQPPPRPPSEVAPLPDDDHYRMVAGNAGNLVVFLGSGANADEQAEPWSKGVGQAAR